MFLLKRLHGAIKFRKPAQLANNLWKNGDASQPTNTHSARVSTIRTIRASIGLVLFLLLQPSAMAYTWLRTDSIFAASSFWYTPIPTSVPLHSKSTLYVAEFLRQKAANYGTVNINTKAYTSPVFTVGANVPTVQVTEWDCQGKGFADAGLLEQWAAVPIPTHALPADGNDAEMTIHQPSTNTIWEFWKTRKVNGNWQACFGGRMTNVPASNGTWPTYYGVTATGLPFLGGQITADELRRGEIRHAIGISLVDAEDKATFSWPAQRSDGANLLAELNRIPEGTRFRLDPTVNVDALSMHPVGKIIAKAAQKYGFVVWDKAGAISIRAQNALSYTALGQQDPYPALFAGTPAYAILNGFPWDKLQFLPRDYRKPGS